MSKYEKLFTHECLHSDDQEFREFIESLPKIHWARYDLSAIRIGWMAKEIALKIQIAKLKAEWQWISVADDVPTIDKPVLLIVDGVIKNEAFQFDGTDEVGDWFRPVGSYSVSDYVTADYWIYIDSLLTTPEGE